MKLQRYLNRRTSVVVMSACIAGMMGASADSGVVKGYANVPQGAYSVFAEVRAKPGKADELRKETLPLITLVRSDPKNLVYFFQEDREQPGHLMFYEVWANQADFEAHNNMPYVKAWFAKLSALAESGVKTTKMRIFTNNANTKEEAKQ